MEESVWIKVLKNSFQFLYACVSGYWRSNVEEREKLGVLLQKEQVADALVIPLLSFYKEVITYKGKQRDSQEESE